MAEPAVGAVEQIESQLKQLVTFGFNSHAQKELVAALRKALSRAEQKMTLEARAEDEKQAKGRTEATQSKMKSLAANRGPSSMEPPKAEIPDIKLDLLGFSSLVRAREGMDVDHELIKKIFKAFDTDGNGEVSAHEYLLYSLSEALAATELRAIDLFKRWDEDNSGTIDEKEFIRACTAMGFAVPSAVASKLFRSLDVDRSGGLKYAELGSMLTRRVGAEASKAELCRYTPGGQQANRDNRLGKIVARDRTQYTSVRTRALPDDARLDPMTPPEKVMEQLGELLSQHQQTIIRLFQDWDEDGNGGIGREEFRRALSGLGYTADKKVVNKLFDQLQAENSTAMHASDMADYLEIEEIHRALHRHVRGSKHARKAPPLPEPVEMPLQVDTKLDLLQFAELARAREGDDLDDEHIKLLFNAFDNDKNGVVSAHEYLTFSLREALMKEKKRTVDLFKCWDADRNGTVSEKEFGQAVRTLGFSVPPAVASMLYRKLDEDGNGSLKYAELSELLSKPQPGREASKAELCRYTPEGQQANRDNRLGKPSARDSFSYETVRVRALPAEAHLDVESDIPVLEQLGMLLTVHSKTMVALLRDWDEDGNGGVDKKEFRKALIGLGYQVERSVMDDLFDNLDIIRPDGFLEYDELQKGMRKFIRPKNAPSRGGGLSRGDPLNRVGAKPSRLAKLQGAKSQGSLASASVTSSTGGFDAFSSVYSYDSIRPTTAVWEPKRYDWKRDFQARWPYLT